MHGVFKMFFEKGTTLCFCFWLTVACGNDNINHQSFFLFAHEMVWPKVISPEKTLIIGHERRKDTEATINNIAVSTLHR